MGSVLRKEVEFALGEVGGGDLVVYIAIAIGAADQGGDGAVEPFAQGVGDAVLDEGQDIEQPCPKSPRDILDGLQATALCPANPLPPDLQRRRAGGAIPQI